MRSASLARRIGPLVASTTVLASMLVLRHERRPSTRRCCRSLRFAPLRPFLRFLRMSSQPHITRDGILARRGEGLRVERISVSAALGPSDTALPPTVWRVTLEGPFPPARPALRDLRRRTAGRVRLADAWRTWADQGHRRLLGPDRADLPPGTRVVWSQSPVSSPRSANRRRSRCVPSRSTTRLAEVRTRWPRPSTTSATRHFGRRTSTGRWS